MGNSSKAVLVVLCFLLAGCSGSDDLEIFGTEYRDPPEAPDFTLENQFGNHYKNNNFNDIIRFLSEQKFIICKKFLFPTLHYQDVLFKKI